MALTVADLQAALALLPSDMPVVLAEDAGGNAFSPLAATDPAMYLADTTWSGEHYLTETDRLAQSDPDEHNEAPRVRCPPCSSGPSTDPHHHPEGVLMSYPEYQSAEEKLADAKQRLGIRDVVVLCGSMRFADLMAEVAVEESVLRGALVLKPDVNMKRPRRLWADPAEAEALKVRLDDQHRQKIRLADRVIVVGDYAGDSTRSEIAYARELGSIRRMLGSREQAQPSATPQARPTATPTAPRAAAPAAIATPAASPLPDLSAAIAALREPVRVNARPTAQPR